MRTFAIGDIHGGLKALVQLLNKMEVKDGDTLIFMGDYVDGWSESAQVIQFLIELSEQINCIFIKGNHDVWCEDWLRDDEVNPTWYMHGGKATIESYEGVSSEEKTKHLEFFERLKMYYIDAENRLFLHAGFTSMHGVEREVFETTLYFDRTLWEMALTMDKGIQKDSAIYPNRLKHYKEIYIGHTPTINFGVDVPMQAINVWNIDTGAAFYGRLSGINIDTKEVFQTDVVKDLYPDETGRNKA
ncbi:metallophosphoesterase family protein [Algibacter sp. 2305UL17-15]|uniref:metallophosphoesterase family protein n=1 Tax=Algibacter sp. 2305UL17-15 TaxID=3231268 RepID=UPI003458FDD5